MRKSEEKNRTLGVTSASRLKKTFPVFVSPLQQFIIHPWTTVSVGAVAYSTSAKRETQKEAHPPVHLTTGIETTVPVWTLPVAYELVLAPLSHGLGASGKYCLR